MSEMFAPLCQYCRTPLIPKEGRWSCDSAVCPQVPDYRLALTESHDGAGQLVTTESASKAVSAFAELWGNALFDCGPQDYEFMQREILERIARPVAASGPEKAAPTCDGIHKYWGMKRYRCLFNSECLACGSWLCVMAGTYSGEIVCGKCGAENVFDDSSRPTSLALVTASR